MKLRHSASGVLFSMIYNEFKTMFSVVCDYCKLDGVAPHSLRHGGATWASLRAWSDARIKAHGRWNSEAYKAYVRAG